MSLTMLVSIFTILAASFWIYLKALPKPIAGIPHNRESAKKVLGDVPGALQWIYKNNAIFSWVVEQCRIHDSPVVQCFMRPFDKPWVIVSDFREAEDIMIRRTREFDRSFFFGDVFVNVLRGNQVHMATGDGWRAHRRLMSDTMSTSFLKETVGPHIYATAALTVDLWGEKARLSKGRPFSASRDVFKGVSSNYNANDPAKCCLLGVLEGVWRAMFGSNPGVAEGQVKFLSAIRDIEVPQDTDSPTEIPTTRDPEAFTAILVDIASSRGQKLGANNVTGTFRKSQVVYKVSIPQSCSLDRPQHLSIPD